MPNHFDPAFIANTLAGLTRRHWVAFAACCAERLLPNYSAFHEAHGWGNPDILRQALNEAWMWLAGSPVSTDRLVEFEKRCQSAMPNTEDFGTLLCSQALDASVAVCETLSLCVGADVTHAVNVASVARDTVDMYIQERDDMDYSDPDFERKILSDPLMVRELRDQYSVLSELSSRDELDTSYLQALSGQFEGKSNLR